MTGKAMHHDTEILARYTPDLSKDRFHVWLTTWHWIPQVIVGLVLLAFGGIPYVLWGTFFRTTYGLHATWLVNSATHLWGSRRFQTSDDSRNSWWVAMLTFGEGWHNNHHAHPVSARHGLAWYEIDMNWIGISIAQDARPGVGRQGRQGPPGHGRRGRVESGSGVRDRDQPILSPEP